MKFTPRTEEDIKSSQTKFAPLPEGDYPFTVLESAEVPSNSAKNAGRIMVKLKLAVHGPNGRDQWVWDYFADWFSEWKLKHFSDSTSQSDAYEAGELEFSGNAQQGAQGFVRVFVEQDDRGRERNAVDDYIVPVARGAKSATEGFAAAKAAVEAATETDDVPF